MSGQIVKYQGGLAYQEGDRVVPMQRQDLAQQFLQIMAGVEQGLIAQSQMQQAWIFMQEQERKAQAEALATVTRFADTAIQSANQNTAISQAAFNEVVGIAHELIEAGKEKDRAIAASQSRQEVYISPWYMWLTGEQALVQVVVLFCVFAISCMAFSFLKPESKQQPSLGVGGASHVQTY